jgi:hypothetical protein
MAEPKQRQHKATYARDKKQGGYIIRVEGPNAARFEDREVPVTKKDGTESVETLGTLLWSGNDEETGKPVALYTFVAKPREQKVFDF